MADRPLKNHKKGGKLIGQGVYGCAFVAPLKCRGKEKVATDIIERKVGKILPPNEASYEYYISTLLRKLALHQNYFITVDEPCSLDSREHQTDEDLSSCEAIKKKALPAFNQITMPFGGTVLSQLKIKIETRHHL